MTELRRLRIWVHGRTFFRSASSDGVHLTSQAASEHHPFCVPWITRRHARSGAVTSMQTLATARHQMAARIAARSTRTCACRPFAAASQPRQRAAGCLLPAAAAGAAAPTTVPRRSGRTLLRCQAAAESDIIDVDGKVIDDRVPVTVGGRFGGRFGKGRCAGGVWTAASRRHRGGAQLVLPLHACLPACLPTPPAGDHRFPGQRQDDAAEPDPGARPRPPHRRHRKRVWRD